MRLNGKVAVVTGGSRGIGFAVVKAFLKEGASVILCASKKETADKAVSDIKAECPDAKVEGIFPNLADFAEVKETMNGIAEKYGRIDILVNNAGVADMMKFSDYTEENFDRVMDLNLKAVFNCSKAAADIMTKQGSGVILNTSSMVSIYGQPSGIAYPTSKFAVNGFTLSLARELGPCGIRVNAVAPGFIKTPMTDKLTEEQRNKMLEQIAMKRYGEVEEIAGVVSFLASDDASYVTGQIIEISGGLMM